MIGGCSGSVGPGARNSFSAALPSSQYQVIHDFNNTDGAKPDAGMIAVNDRLYGTTETGGRYSNGGVIFSMTPEGSESVLHDFGYSTDGSDPNAGLTVVNGVLYGTAKRGGKHGDGTVFAVKLSGRERTLYSFKGGTDGQQPHSALFYAHGFFYGTTYAGGAYGDGTIYEVGKGGSEEVLHAFGKSYVNGAEPNTGFVTADGKLYSLTFGGGSHRKGIAYSLTFSGTEHVLHSFGKPYDGAHPYNAQLVADGGVFYGTTCDGGLYGHGTVYTITLAGRERVIYDFGKASGDPVCPYDGLVLLDGVMYGTSYNGGTLDSGTLFSITYDGTLKVLHSFGASGDGALPAAPLTVLDGTLFGTTFSGGSGGDDGTVFKYTP